MPATSTSKIESRKVLLNDYITPDPWSLIEEGFDPDRVESSESLFSLGNGAMGQRTNFIEKYSGPTFQGSYVGGVYYPDRTKVGWWKNGYPEYFAKVLNAPSWIGMHVKINGEGLDLAKCTSVDGFRRELNMKEGWYKREFSATLTNGLVVNAKEQRFLSLAHDELGAIKFDLQVEGADAEIEIYSFVDGGITNKDTNWDDKFWELGKKEINGHRGFLESTTLKTEFGVCTFMETLFNIQDDRIDIKPSPVEEEKEIGNSYNISVLDGQRISIVKFGGYTSSRYHDETQLTAAASVALNKANELGFEGLLELQKEEWAKIWQMSDITIEGDVKAQQGIRFNIFQLNQTYLGRDSRLNIGPKGFTGEKYGGSTYWDTEAYCLPFYMATKNSGVARNLLKYRYDHLWEAMDNAEKLGFTNGAALYPMVTMNGEESHNEWEITFEEIHRNGAMSFAIFNYVRYTGDHTYLTEMGLEVLIGVARFWAQRFNWSEEKQKFVMLGVTGPNEYENNINNNWYTNFIAKWCLEYTAQQMVKLKSDDPTKYDGIAGLCKLDPGELDSWISLAEQVYQPYSEKYGVFLQQDGFLDKELKTVSELDPKQRPINQYWSWDRILRSPYIKQADVLQGFYFFEDQFSTEQLQAHFDFYEPFTVHESSLSPCVHSILAAKLNRMDQAYEFYLRTSRLDLDDYNKEVAEGLHITSMAGTWMSIVEGFGGMRIKDDQLTFAPQIPKQWESYSFKVNFREHIVQVSVATDQCKVDLMAGEPLNVMVNGKQGNISVGNPFLV